MDLYLKSGPDGKEIGDCPFAHNVRMVIHLKVCDCEAWWKAHTMLFNEALPLQGLKCNLRPCPPGDDNSKPDWLVEDFQGKMPCLDDEGRRTVRGKTRSVYCFAFWIVVHCSLFRWRVLA